MKTHVDTIPTARTFRTHIAAARVESAGIEMVRYGLVLVLAWIGFLKFQSYEAMAIMPLVAHSPFISWGLGAFGLESTAHIIGSFEIFAAVLIALRPVLPIASFVGSSMAVLTFLTTITFLFSTPAAAVFTPDGVPFLTMVGQFLIKDVILLGAAVATAGEALHTASRNRRAYE